MATDPQQQHARTETDVPSAEAPENGTDTGPDAGSRPRRPATTGTLPDRRALAEAFVRLCDVVARLRSPEGCPWDRAQTLETIKPFTLEETYELLEAIDSGDDAAIVEELGDVLLQVVLDAQIGRDEGRFDILDVIRTLTEKLIRRHPHVFGDQQADSPQAVMRHWDRVKSREKEKQRRSIMDGLPAELPQLARAARIAERAARVGYDFPHREMLFDKLREELDELATELFGSPEIPHVPASVDVEPTPDVHLTDPTVRERVESELGDVLFVLANIARRWGINPEEALRKSNRKFESRVRFIEEQLRARGKDIREASLIEMEDLYQQGKRRGR
ncbi:MAG: nucleoside triphosphate pyrophosphohydrolase [Planctomycetota bacterium]|nr:MAG: nucleoside triphosphate pyrophosphohydrolase [Planctomycetota bacterium]